MAQALGKRDAHPRTWHRASPPPASPSLQPHAPCCGPVLGPGPAGEGLAALGRVSIWGEASVWRGAALLSWGSLWCRAGCYELAGLVKSSTPVMVALQKKQSLLFIRCWLMQALGQRRKECELPPARHGGGQGLAVALVGIVHASYSLA